MLGSKSFNYQLKLKYDLLIRVFFFLEEDITLVSGGGSKILGFYCFLMPVYL